jgi:hypothetical protein
MRTFLHPGPILSINDGQWHYVGAVELTRLYHLRLGDCIVIPADCDREHTYQYQDSDRHYYPQYGGQY